MKRRLFLDVVVRESAAVLELLARKDQTLLVRGDAFFVLDLRLDVVDRVRGLNLQGDGLAGDCASRGSRAQSREGGEKERQRSGRWRRMMVILYLLRCTDSDAETTWRDR
jgi:hypothetical protein